MHEEVNDQSELFEHLRVEVDRGQELLRMDKFLVNRLHDVSRTRIQAAAQAGNITVNGTAAKPNYRVKPGDIISLLLPHPPHEQEILPEQIPLDVVHEDPDLIVINKQAGMVVHPGVGHYTGTLVNALMYHFRDIPMFQSGETRPGLVHRIDKDTTGLLVVAKTELALNRLAKQFFERSVKRLYSALVWGVPDPATGSVEGHIGRHLKDRRKMQVFPDGSVGKHAVTHYRVVENLGYVSLVECRLETGRTHQIRVHFQHIRHPLFNDADYGGDQILRGTTSARYKQFINNCFNLLPRQALHARTLEFSHPSTGKIMSFDTGLPEDMNTVLERWRRYAGNSTAGL